MWGTGKDVLLFIPWLVSGAERGTMTVGGARVALRFLGVGVGVGVLGRD